MSSLVREVVLRAVLILMVVMNASVVLDTTWLLMGKLALVRMNDGQHLF